MPSGVFTAHAVVIGGKVYIGGGNAEGTYYKVLEYTIRGGQWREIETPVRYFGVAVVNNQLIIIGGDLGAGNDTDQVWVLGSDANTWRQPFPAMPTARQWPSAVGYKRWVLVVGGDEKKNVEVLDTVSKKWYTAAPLPSGAFHPSLAVIQDTLYVIWEESAICISIPMLISHAMSKSAASSDPRTIEWQLLSHTITKDPTATSFHGFLLAVGAWYSPSSTIAMYLPQTEQWLTVARLPTPRKACIYMCCSTRDWGTHGGGGRGCEWRVYQDN